MTRLLLFQEKAYLSFHVGLSTSFQICHIFFLQYLNISVLFFSAILQFFSVTKSCFLILFIHYFVITLLSDPFTIQLKMFFFCFELRKKAYVNIKWDKTTLKIFFNLMNIGYVFKWLYCSLTGSETISLLFKKLWQKEGFLDCCVTSYELLRDI